MLQGLLVLNYPNYVYERYHGTLLLYAIMLIALIFNTILARQLPNIESAILVLHIIGFFAILIPLTVLAPHGSAHDVFAVFSNSGAFQTQGLSFFVGIITSVFAFVGMYGKRRHFGFTNLLIWRQAPMERFTCVKRSKMRQPLFPEA